MKFLVSKKSTRKPRSERYGEHSKTMNETTEVGWNFDNSYSRLKKSFYARVNPVPVRSPRIVVFNHPLAASLGLNTETWATTTNAAAICAGNILPQGAEPIAQAYAGHQFGHFTVLGDGRAILLGEQTTPNGQRFDIQLKGSGRTPFSRNGDGRAALGPMLREYIISEAMYSLGIPTTRSLAVVTTGEPVFRSTTLPGAVLTRVAASHIRVGTFEHVSALGDREGIQTLADYTLHRHFPELTTLGGNPYLGLLQAVIGVQASLVARWQLVGFIHGVMNTDNMTISGETIDYGPCAFMDAYDPDTVFSSIDRQGRYRYCNQPMIAQWNLSRFAETLLPLIHSNQAQAIEMATQAIESFPSIFQRHWLAGMRAKLGLFTEEANDVDLVETLLQWMQKHHADYTNTFHALTLENLPDRQLFHDAAFTDWCRCWQARLKTQSESKDISLYLMRSHNPSIIPRNHRVEEALKAAVEHSDFTIMQKLLAALKTPYAESPDHADYRTPPVPSEHPYQTFCGT
jgi:uncharacterized protein YdiU (UPF0061 family)